MRIAVREIELCGQLKLPSDLQEYIGIRLFCQIGGQIKGRITIWNPYKVSLQKDFKYPENFGSSLLLAQIFFSPLNPPVDLKLVKSLLCSLTSISPEGLDQPYSAAPLFIPSLTASIVIPTKDRPTDLAEALQRLVTHQTGVPHEIIVVDNKPASGLTAPVVAQFPGVRYVTESRPGVGYARNTGTLAARGDIIVTTDDDIRVGDGWLDNMIAPFADPQIDSVMGLVLPYELESSSQLIFEELRRATKFNYDETRFDATFFNQPYLPEIGKCGNTSSAAFRFRLFADPRVGPFEVALGAGTPARGGGDIYFFYRLLAAGKVHLYQPRARAYHKHRSTMALLKKQLAWHDSGYTAMLTLLATRHKDHRVNKKLVQALIRYHLEQVRLSLISKNVAPLEVVLARVWGALNGPLNLRRSLALTKKLGNYSPQQFSTHLAERAPLAKKIYL